MAFLYTAGYAAVGFGLLFFGSVWRFLVRDRILWQRTPVDLPLAVFGGVLLVSAFTSPFRRLALEVTLILILSGVVYFGALTWLLHHDPRARGKLLSAWALGALPATAVGLAEAAVTHARAQIPRGVGPNGLGTTLLLASVLALGLAFRTRGPTRVLWLGAGVFNLVGLMATGSRASLLGWVVGSTFLAWWELRSQPRRMAAVLAAGLVVIALAGILAPQLGARIRTTVSDLSGNRLRIWHTSLKMIKAHPLLGTGFGTFEKAYGQVKAPEMSPEPFAFNLALNIAVETGILGLGAVLWIAAACAREWLHWGRSVPPGTDPLRALIAALWVGLLVDQMADNTLSSISTSAGVWLLLALLVSPSVGREVREIAPDGRRVIQSLRPTVTPASREVRSEDA